MVALSGCEDRYKKGNVYTVEGIFFCCKHVGYRIAIGGVKIDKEGPCCGECGRDLSDTLCFLAKNFAPYNPPAVEISESILEQCVEVKETIAPITQPL